MNDPQPLELLPDATAPRPRFADFWRVYPKKVKRRDSERLWKMKKLDAIADEIIKDVKTRLDEDARWLKGYIPDPPTYLRGERYNDEISQ